MMSEMFDFNLDPVQFITVGTVGPPGRRTFFLQGAARAQVVSLVIEKEHAAALSLSIRRLLGAAEGAPEEEPEQPIEGMDLQKPIEPAFRVGQIGIGIDEDRDMVVLIASEFMPGDEDADDDDEEDADDDNGDEGDLDAAPAENDEALRARFVATFDQMRILARHAIQVVNAGRPVCELCGEPMDPEGHFCARRNGHPPPPS
jgi:uncharacterized repeat protein (TIGR03847 family)